MAEAVYWHLQDLTDLPSDTDWLAPAERMHLASLKVESRRRDWLLGRWTAKEALRQVEGDTRSSGVDVGRQFEILPADNGSPRVCSSGTEMPLSLSLSHREGRALCCVFADGGVGCDLEVVEERSQAFIEDYFTPVERAQIDSAGAAGPSVVANALWSAKESVLKLLQIGLSIDSRVVEVRGAADALTPEWHRIAVFHSELGREFPGWWCRLGECILTVITDAKTGPPVPARRPGRGRVPAS